jgi:hypothetical protein
MFQLAEEALDKAKVSVAWLGARGETNSSQRAKP